MILRITLSSDLVVCVCKEGDDQGQEVEGDSLVEVLRVLVAVHGNVGHLLHPLRPHARLYNMKQVNTKKRPDFWNYSFLLGQRFCLCPFKTVSTVGVVFARIICHYIRHC